MANRYPGRYIQYYTGTEAPKLTPRQPRRTKTSLPKPVKEQSYTIRLDPLPWCGIVVSVLLVVLMVVGWNELRSAKTELEQVTNYVTTLRQEHGDLEERYEQGYDLEMIEKAAVGLGMIPVEDAQHIRIAVEAPAQEESSWQRFTSFLTGLFA